ncbi:hypothetical protein GOB93_01775 [Acetobacter musti]|uniref:DUF6468 domain-containing protein n=1 Tax=Acetobacter musti TaxID=864732 RepID=A0ABX0JKR6_9PROT|nr:DUF6468 domain-containing protein [Acetobacter musti]NHN83368.1 hypothetical protein [Acetobacter musti]
MTTFEYCMEFILCILLIAGIFYSIYLGRALAVLRRDRRELADLVAKLDESGRRAEDGVEKLQTAGDVSGRALGRMIDQSRMLHSELEALSERADSIAGRLDGLVRQSNRQMPKARTGSAESVQMPADHETVPPFEGITPSWSGNADAAMLPVSSEKPASPKFTGVQSPGTQESIPSLRPYEQRSRQRTAAEQDLIRALRMG